MLNRPAVGVIKERSSSSDVVIKDVGIKKLDSDYFQLSYPGRYELQTNKNNSASLQSWILIAHQALGLGQASKIAISIVEQESGGVKENSAYKHAEAFPEYYSVSATALEGSTVTVLNRTNPSFERTILWPHRGYLLAVSLTSAVQTEELVAELDAIMSSLVWK